MTKTHIKLIRIFGKEFSDCLLKGLKCNVLCFVNFYEMQKLCSFKWPMKLRDFCRPNTIFHHYFLDNKGLFCCSLDRFIFYYDIIDDRAQGGGEGRGVESDAQKLIHSLGPKAVHKIILMRVGGTIHSLCHLKNKVKDD